VCNHDNNDSYNIYELYSVRDFIDTGTKIYEKELDVFNKYLSVWVAICIVFGTLVGYFFPSLSVFLAELELSNVSLPIAVVLLIMMYPIMLNVKYSELLHIKKMQRLWLLPLP